MTMYETLLAAITGDGSWNWCLTRPTAKANLAKLITLAAGDGLITADETNRLMEELRTR